MPSGWLQLQDWNYSVDFARITVHTELIHRMYNGFRNDNKGEAVSCSEETPMKVAHPRGRF
jgi:hypothetical protein